MSQPTVAHRKSVARVARLEARIGRIEFLRERHKNDPARVEELQKETKRRKAELAYLQLKVEAELDANPEWANAVVDNGEG